ncbi:hypothetical protein HK101_007260 [Irineochytrium annulatum]|nr:hypothetical protein HK101_007260 [Irineochytrium annulatum]
MVFGLRSYGSGHDDHHHVKDDSPSKLQPDEWLKIAREWPHEYYAPKLYPIDPFPSKPTFTDGSETQSVHTTMFNRFTTRLLLLLGTAYGLYTLDDYVNGQQETHPLTRLLASYMKPRDELERETRYAFWSEMREADDRLITMKQARPDYAQWRYHDESRLERCSDWLIVPGSQVDMSDVQFRHSWQHDDDLFGPPFPKK